MSKKLRELNPGFDGKLMGIGSIGHAEGNPQIETGVVTALGLYATNLVDLSPVRVFVRLQKLACEREGNLPAALSDLSPLKGMSLTKFACTYTNVSDLSPLAGMPLAMVGVGGTKVTSLLPLQGMPLSGLYFNNTGVSDLSPLKGMPLMSILADRTNIADLSPLEGCQRLTSINVRATKVTSAQVAALRKALPNCKVEWDGAEKGPVAGSQGLVKPRETPEFQQWVKATQALPAEQQIEAVSKKLMELNPGFDGKVTDWDGKGTRPFVRNGQVVAVKINSVNLKDLSPLRVFRSLQRLNISADSGKSNLSDLSPLEGLQLTRLICIRTAVTDLSPLRGMPLTDLSCGVSQVRDLTPLQALPQLKALDFGASQVSDLSPIKALPLDSLGLTGTKVTDLSQLSGMHLTEIRITPNNITKGLEVIRAMKSVKIISIGQTASERLPTEEFWKRYDAGEFSKPVPASPSTPRRKLAYLEPAFQQWVAVTQKQSAEIQIEAVSNKLMELNPGFDGKVTSRIDQGVVKEFGFSTNDVRDISPVSALPKLAQLNFGATGGQGKLADLSPLKGMQLNGLVCNSNPISDLTPLAGMSLKRSVLRSIRT